MAIKTQGLSDGGGLAGLSGIYPVYPGIAAESAALGAAFKDEAQKQANVQAYKLQQGNANACQEQPAKATEIPSKIGVLFEATEYLSNQVARLEKRLARVLVQVPAAIEQNQTSGPYGYATGMGEELSQIIGRINTLVQCLDSIDARLEL